MPIFQDPFDEKVSKSNFACSPATVDRRSASARARDHPLDVRKNGRVMLKVAFIIAVVFFHFARKGGVSIVFFVFVLAR